MRVIGGDLSGRRLQAPKGTTTRPTTDRVRESLLNVLASRLGPELAQARVLDPFAGSGALGIEALSRGATHATFVERDRGALSALRANVASLGLSQRARIHADDASVLVKRGVLAGPYSLILLDPPYTLDPTVVSGLLVSLRKSGAVQGGTMVTWEHAAGSPVDWPEGFELDARKRYGSTEIDVAVLA